MAARLEKPVKYLLIVSGALTFLIYGVDFFWEWYQKMSYRGLSFPDLPSHILDGLALGCACLGLAYIIERQGAAAAED